MVFTVYWWSMSWYILLFIPFIFLFNIKFWLSFLVLFNSFSLESYYFYFFILKIIQQYHLLLKISYFIFFIILGSYFIKISCLTNFFNYIKLNHKFFYWINLFFYLYVFIGLTWTFMEPSWVNWWLNENIEELMLCIIFFYFISYTHFSQLYYRFWFMCIIYLFCLFYWVESHNTLFNSRHLKLLFYINVVNFGILVFYKKLLPFFYYRSGNMINYFSLWPFYYTNVVLHNKLPKTKTSSSKLNYYFFLFNIITYFNILIFIIPTFLNFWNINFLLDSYYYDIVYLWLVLYSINYNFFKFKGPLFLVDCAFTLAIFNKLNLKDLIHIILFFTLLLNFSLVYWDSYITLSTLEKLNYISLNFNKEFTENFFVLKSSLFINHTILKIKYMQILEYLFLLWSINLFIIKYGVRRLTFTAILS